MVVKLGGEVKLSISDVVRVARLNEEVALSEEALGLMRDSRAVLEGLVAKGVSIYGVNTGLGELYNVTVGADEVAGKSMELLMDHAAGVGDHAPDDWVRGTMVVRAHQLSRGFSGVREVVVDTLIQLLNRGVVPIVPRFGSVGASGDLAPLAHIALAMLGRGMVRFRGVVVEAHKALREAGIPELRLSYKEALALINGNSYSTAVALLGLWDSLTLVKAAIASMALALEASGASTAPFNAVTDRTRLHPGERWVAGAVVNMVKGSSLVNMSGRLQDPYSIRCIPQVVGSILDSVNWAIETVTDEANSVSDNPIILGGGASSTCFFHGQYIALPVDLARVALSVLGNLVERLIMQLMRKEINNVGNYLANGPWRVGLMLTQYTAASLAGRLRELASPSTIHNIPTSGLQEDVNSMSANSAIKLHEANQALSMLVALLAYVSHAVLNAKGECGGCGELTRAVYRLIDGAVAGKPTINDAVGSIMGRLSELASLVQ